MIYKVTTYQPGSKTRTFTITIDEAADMAIALRHMPLPLKAGDSSTFGRVRVDVEADHWLENATKPGVHSV